MYSSGRVLLCYRGWGSVRSVSWDDRLILGTDTSSVATVIYRSFFALKEGLSTEAAGTKRSSRVVGQRMPSSLGAASQDSEAVSSDWITRTTFLLPRPILAVQISSGSQVAFHLRRRRLCTWTRSHSARLWLHGMSPKNTIPFLSKPTREGRVAQERIGHETIAVLDFCHGSERGWYLLIPGGTEGMIRQLGGASEPPTRLEGMTRDRPMRQEGMTLRLRRRDL